MINERPTICNICGGEVKLVKNSEVYHGQSFGSGYCYLCTKCGAYVGTHRKRPYDALGILADKQMRDMKMACHDLFDRKWKGKNSQHHARELAYERLAKKMKIPVEDCHFGHFNLDKLNQAYEILIEELKQK